MRAFPRVSYCALPGGTSPGAVVSVWNGVFCSDIVSRAASVARALGSRSAAEDPEKICGGRRACGCVVVETCEPVTDPMEALMKQLFRARWIPGLALAALFAAGCGATDGSGATASAQALAQDPSAPGEVRPRGPRDPAAMAHFLDRNHDGRVEVSELPERAREHLAAADADRDGVLSAAELAAHHEQRQAERFARIDTNGDGAVTEAEVEAGRWAHLQAADADHDGRVTRAELEAAHASGALRGPGHPGGHRGGRFGGPVDPARMIEHLDRDGDGRDRGAVPMRPHP